MPRVLVIEDNPADLFLIREALKFGAMPKQVTELNDGEKAIRYLTQQQPYQHASRPDLIVLDLNLPRIDGRQVLELVKQNRSLRQIPVVVLSTSNHPGDILSAYECNANCYLTKPSTIEDFFEAVRQIEDFWLQCVSLP